MNLRIKFRSETLEQFVERYAIDVSRGGIFIRTREPLAVGTQLRFDFQLQDTSPLMAGEGTVVWIREHDPNRAGVTPGMGVRFDKLTPASQPILERILTEKGHRDLSGPMTTTTTTVSTAPSGKSGATTLPTRRPSSTFTALDPRGPGLGVPQPTGAGAAPAGGGMAPASAGPGGGPSAGPADAIRPSGALSGSTLSPLGAAKPPTAGSGALPTSESQSALNRLPTGSNLGSFTPGGAPRTKSPLPLPRSPLVATPSGLSALTGNSSGAPAVPTAIEDSERTQIADALPDFSNEPTSVGGKALGISGTGSGRTATITATSRRTPTASADPGTPSGLASSPPPAASSNGAGEAATPDPGAARTTSPDGSHTVGAGAGPPVGRLSGSQMVVPPTAGATNPGAAQPAAAATARSTTSHAAIAPAKKRPTAFVFVGVLAGAAAAAVVIAARVSNREADAPIATVANSAPATSPPPATSPTGAPVGAAAANPVATSPEATKAEPAPTAAAATPGEAKTREAKSAEAKSAETKSAEAQPIEAKPAEAKPAEANPAETKPSEAKTTAAETSAVKPAGGRKPRIAVHKKVAAGGKTESATDAGGEAVEAVSAADATVGNIARVNSIPAGAEVLIDGQSMGKTPFLGKEIDPTAPHALTLRKDGFETHEHMVSASDWIKGKGTGQSLKITVKLRKAHGAGDAETGAAEKKPEKSSESPAEPTKTEPAPATTP